MLNAKITRLNKQQMQHCYCTQRTIMDRLNQIVSSTVRSPSVASTQAGSLDPSIIMLFVTLLIFALFALKYRKPSSVVPKDI